MEIKADKVDRAETLRDPKKDRDNGPTDMYEGTLRVVTEQDVLDDPRVVAAGAVVGQLYDFSNLSFVKDNALEDEVIEKNEKKNDLLDENGDPIVPTAPRYSSESERREMGVENPEEKP